MIRNSISLPQWGGANLGLSGFFFSGGGGVCTVRTLITYSLCLLWHYQVGEINPVPVDWRISG